MRMKIACHLSYVVYEMMSDQTLVDILSQRDRERGIKELR